MNYSNVRPSINALYKLALGVAAALLVSACTSQSPSSNYDVCTREGYFKSIEIVGGYYRCVYRPATGKYTLFRYTCPAGKEFNEAAQRCE